MTLAFICKFWLLRDDPEIRRTLRTAITVEKLKQSNKVEGWIV
jgi:hypothetical protein